MHTLITRKITEKERIEYMIISERSNALMNNSLLVYKQTGILLPFHFGPGRLLTNLTTFLKIIVIMSRKYNCIISLS